MYNKKIKNVALRIELKNFTDGNIKSIEKGSISGSSIEIEFTEQEEESSYLYYDDEESRDSDYEELHNLINE